MELQINKRHLQTGGFAVRFDQGDMNLYLQDGEVNLAACSSDPQLFFYGPHLGCALGITGYVAYGDFNRDGVSDANQYWSIDSVVPAFRVAPGFPDLCSLISAPPSKLPRPLKLFRDGKVTVFHDLRTPQVTQYNLAFYEMVRRYGSVRQVETAVAAGTIDATAATGTINVVVTGQGIVGSPLTIPVTLVPQTEDTTILPLFAEEWAENVRVALAAQPAITSLYTVSGSGNAIVLTEITPNGNDATLNVAITPGTFTSPNFPIDTSVNSVAGTVVAAPAAALKQMNEELVNGRYIFSFPSLQNPQSVPVNMPVTIVPNVEAFGSNPRKKGGFQFLNGKFDNGYYQMDPRIINTIRWTGNDATNIVPGDQIYFSILTPAEDRLSFPPTIPQAPVILSSPTVQSYTLPPSFYDVGQEGVVDVRYQRDLSVSPSTKDRSRREFRMRVKFVDTYAGYAQLTFPLGTNRDTSANGNYDGDALSNLEEYAFQFPTNADLNATARETFVPALVPESGAPGFPLLVEEFNRVIQQEPEPILDAAAQPAGPIGPELDGTNRIVYRVPKRARTGTSLNYSFVENTTNAKGKVKSKKIKAGPKWEIIEESGPTVTRNVQIEVTVLDPTTREVYFVRTRSGTTNVNITQKYLTLRSKAPVKNPAAPLPTLAVKVASVDIR
ncbi:hypothetical protein OKA04_15485 [Luteolibacter flavescens]|uniref:Uncharacterized protein n=1 Tax=Luteolibacter flavescens TaxID=1859460 RepID=A0ABT3FS58_9BACT|nr:hypothetical protein [Luteolibacter flavescens]MCW1886139.1 hypothetical protein [Luteolibacter flavescens]